MYSMLVLGQTEGQNLSTEQKEPELLIFEANTMAYIKNTRETKHPCN